MVTQGAGEIRNGARNDRASGQKGFIAIAGAVVAMLALATALFGGARAEALPPSVTVTPGQALYKARGGDPLEFTVSASPNSNLETYRFEIRGISGQGQANGLTSTGDFSAKATYRALNGYTGRAVVGVRATNESSGAFADGSVPIDVYPKTELTAGPGVSPTPSLTNDNTPTLAFKATTGGAAAGSTVDLGGATFECKIDTGSWTACSSPFTSSTLSDGTHTFSVRATNSGLTDFEPASTDFTVDATAPNVSITGGPNTKVKSTSATFTFTNDDPSATVECKLDSGSWGACSSPKAYNSLGQGAHTFYVRATDSASNEGSASRSWTADTQASVTITGGPSGVSGNTDATPTFTFSSDADIVQTQCRVYETGQTAGPLTACSSPFTSQALNKNVSYTFEVKVTDDVGNTDEKTRVWTQSNTPPSLGSPTVTVSAGDTATVDLSSGATDSDGDTVGTYTVTSGGSGGIGGFGTRITPGTANLTSGSVQVPTASNAAGSYTFTFSASDGRQGGTSNGSATVRVRPDTKDITDPASPISDSTPEWTFTAVSETTDFECQLLDANNGDSVVTAWTSCLGGSYAPSVADGKYKLEVRAKINDLVDDSPLTSGVVEVDTISPDVDITGPNTLLTDSDLLSNIADPAFTFVTTDPDPRVTFECRTDKDAAGVWAACTSGTAVTGLSDGNRTFEVRAKDAAGNKANVDSFAWERDTTEPEFEITSGPDDGDWTNLRRPTWSYTESDPNPIADDKNLLGATTTCQIDSGTVANDCPGTWTAPTFLNDGARKLTLTVLDAAGNLGTDEVEFTVATTSPAAILEETPDNPSTSNASFEFISPTDLGPAGKFQCRTSANGGSFSQWQTCVSPFTPPGLATGSNTFQVRAVDSAGNAGSGPFISSYTWTVLGTPGAQLTATKTGFGNAAFRFVSSDPVATFECQLDGGSWSACTAPKNYSGLAVGSHTFKVRAVNEVATGSPAQHTWSATPPAAPDTEITRRPAGTTSQKNATFEFTSDDPLATFECRVDGGEWAACESPIAYADLANGSHTFEVRAGNEAGQKDSSPASASWTIADQSVEPVAGQITPSIKGPRSVKAGKSVNLRVILRNVGTEDANGAEVCMSAPKAMVKGDANRCKTLDVEAQSTVSVNFRVDTKAGMSGKARFRASVEYNSSSGKQKELKGHVTLIK